MKIATYAVLIFIATLLIFCLFKGCETTKPSDLEVKANHSLLIDSIVSAHNTELQKQGDSIVLSFKHESDSIKQSNKYLYSRYTALRLLVRPLQAVKVDSLTQVVNDVPAIAYNASIYSGVVCDSLLIGKDLELNIKDSIISVREIQLDSEKKASQVQQQAIQDQKAFYEQVKKQSEKAKKSSKRNLFLGMAIPPALAILGKVLKLY